MFVFDPVSLDIVNILSPKYCKILKKKERKTLPVT